MKLNDFEKEFVLRTLNVDSTFMHHMLTAAQEYNSKYEFSNSIDFGEVAELFETYEKFEEMRAETKEKIKRQLADLFKQGYYAVYDNNEKRFMEIREIES